jgi:hypothetical protein
MDRLISPSTDFRSVRDGRNAQVFYVDIDLSTARSAAATTGLVLPISGNSFYCDANPSDGNAFVRFQDTNFDRAPVPLYVSPGVIFNIPYTQVMIENSAQPGKKIRIAYGIDVDFQPGSVAQIAVTNNGGFTAVRPEAISGSWTSVATLAANTPETIVAPGANTTGLILLSGSMQSFNAGGVPISVFIAKTTAPTTNTDGEVLCASQVTSYSSGNFLSGANFEYPQFVPAGKGLYFICDQALTAVYTNRSIRWRAA